MANAKPVNSAVEAVLEQAQAGPKNPVVMREDLRPATAGEQNAYAPKEGRVDLIVFNGVKIERTLN